MATLPRMASSIDDVFDKMGLSEKIFTSDIPSRIPRGKASTQGILLERAVSNPQMVRVLMHMYYLGYTDLQIISLCKAKGFDLEKYLDPVDALPEKKDIPRLEGPKEEPKEPETVTTITTSSVTRTLQIFCEKKASSISAVDCIKCKELESINYDSMQVICKYDPMKGVE